MSQPKWKLIANLGDASPLEYGGYFIYEDETGVYPPEAELLEVLNEDEPDEDRLKYRVYRFILEQCTLTDGILSDNKYHPLHPAWFAEPESERTNRPQDTTYLKNVADYIGSTLEEMQSMFCSNNPLDRATAYRAIGEYHGLENLDDYPLELTRTEAIERYKDEVTI